MRLRTLHLRNYRRHRHTVVEFADGVTALVGRNGSGKSSLLEAIGFALFGTSATRTSKDLLRHDAAAPADAVSVVLEFDLANQAIRVERELRGRNLTPSATVSADGVVLVPPGAGSSEAVTRLLEQRLGLNAEGFFTTVVARQKELSRLADQKPTERKRLILEMLGVDDLDRAIARARRRRLDAEAGAKALADALIDPEELASETRAARQSVAALQGALESHEAAWASAQAAAQDAATRLQTAEAQAKAHAEAVRRHEQAVQRWDSAARTTVQVNAQLEEARAAEHEAKALAPLAARLPGARASLVAAQDHARRSEERRRGLAAVATEERGLNQLQAELAAAPKPESPDSSVAAEAERAKADAEARLARLEGALAVAQHNLAALEERLDGLGRLGDSAPCPTCERPLADHLPRLRDSTEAARASAATKCSELTEAASTARAAAAAATASVAAMQAATRAAEAAAARNRFLTERVAEARLRHQRTLDALPDDPGPVPDVAPMQAAVAEAEAARDSWLRAQARAERGAALEVQLADARQEEAEAAAAKEQATATLAGIPDPTAPLASAQAASEAARAAERQAGTQVVEARSELRVAEQVLEAALRRRAEEQARRKQLAQLQEQARYWAALAGARGGGLLDNFKIHLVSRVGPAIAAEASRLLTRFTAGRYTEIVLDEHYSITVAEGGVAYPLERFSGGEADVVHLALRLAVSRLLAQRAGGAELRFLALDEVFGSLDAERRELVAGTLEELTHLYSQVVAVTHLEDLQELDHVISVHAENGESIVTVRS